MRFFLFLNVWQSGSTGLWLTVAVIEKCTARVDYIDRWPMGVVVVVIVVIVHGITVIQIWIVF